MPGEDKEVAEAPEVTKDLPVNETSTGFVDAVGAEEKCLCLASDLHVEYASARMQNQCTGLEASDGTSDKATELLIFCNTG
jgi:hypothetical protein